MTWDKFEKLVSLVRQRVTNVVLYRLQDPRIGFVTISKVELTRDLKTCTVFYSVVGEKGDKTKTAKALDAAGGFIQKEVGKTLRTRIMPRVVFTYDDSMEKAGRINRILRKIREENADAETVAPEGGGEPTDDLDSIDDLDSVDDSTRGEE